MGDSFEPGIPTGSRRFARLDRGTQRRVGGFLNGGSQGPGFVAGRVATLRPVETPFLACCERGLRARRLAAPPRRLKRRRTNPGNRATNAGDRSPLEACALRTGAPGP